MRGSAIARLRAFPTRFATRIAGVPAILLAAVTWSAFGPLARSAFDTGLTAGSLAFWRLVIAGSLFFLQVRLTRTPWLPRRDRVLAGVYGATGIAGMFVTYGLSLQQLGVATATVLINTAPAWVALFAWMRFGSRPGAAGLAALAMTIVGAALVAGPGGSDGLPAASLALGLGAGVVYALYTLQGAGRLKQHRPASVLAWAMPIGALAMLPLATLPSPEAWAPVIAASVVSTYLPFSLYLYGLRTVEPTRAATLLAVEPVLSATLAWVALGERTSAVRVGGTVLVIVGVAVMTRFGARRAAAAAVEAEPPVLEPVTAPA